MHMNMKRLAVVFLFTLTLGACTETQYAAHLAKGAMGTDVPAQQNNYKIGKPYKIAGQTYQPQESFNHVETGIASWYGPGFDGKRTANGERFDKNELTAAHRTLQMPSLVRVTNLGNGRAVVLRVNDRGPFSKSRVIDVSERGAELLGFKNNGTAKVKIEVLEAESRQLAEMAKRGQSTKGYEVAVNNAPPSLPREAIQTVSFDPASSSASAEVGIQGHVAPDGRFLPDAVVSQAPVNPARNNIFIQAGAFSDQQRAAELSRRLASLGPSQVYPAQVNGQTFYRVRIGPYSEVAQADSALNQAVNYGAGDARLIVD